MRRRAFSVAIFAIHNHRALLIHHLLLDKWLPVGGEIEPGETPLEAAQRELLEETGLVGSFERNSTLEGVPPGLLCYEEHEAGPKGLHMNFVFVARVFRANVISNHEFSEHQWLSAAELDAFPCPPNVRNIAKIALS